MEEWKDIKGYESIYQVSRGDDFELILAEREEMLEAFRELLIDSMSYYPTYPNAHRMAKEDYFSKEIEILERAGKKIER